MRRHHTIAICAAAGTLVLGACQAWHGGRTSASGGPRTVVLARGEAATGHFEISSGALVRRREVQTELDAARQALGAGARERASAMLRAAAHFFAGHAAGADAAARRELAAAAELDGLAARVDAGRRVAPTAVVAASAHANRAEAAHHCLAAVDAWARGEHTDTGDELVMTVDHVERALVDEGRPVSAGTRRRLADARETAAALMRDDALPPERVDATLADLGDIIQAR